MGAGVQAEREIGRRSVIKLLVAGGVTAAAVGTGVVPPGPVVAWAGRAARPEPDGVAALGRVYLRRHPAEAHPTRLLRQLPAVRSAHPVRPQLPRLTSTIVADFDTGRVVNVDGWELARSEARAAAAIALGR